MSTVLPVYGPPTRSQALTALAEAIREATGIAWEYACWEAERYFTRMGF